jgi:hypothetical protein
VGSELEAMKNGVYEKFEVPTIIEEVRGLVEGAVEGGQCSLFTDDSKAQLGSSALRVFSRL